MEMDTVPSWWTKAFNTLDEVWVPSHFHADILRSAGVEKAVVVPGTTNKTDYFERKGVANTQLT
jgi:hypothetical protein